MIDEVTNVLDLPVAAHDWYVDWSTEDEEEAPVLMLWFDAENEAFKGFTLSPPGESTFMEQLTAMLSDPYEGEAVRPKRVVVRAAEVKAELQPVLKPLQIEVAVGDFSDEVQTHLDDIRPMVLRDFLVGTCLSPDIETDAFEVLLSAVEALQMEAPWDRYPSGSMLVAEGESGAELCLVLFNEPEASGLAVADGYAVQTAQASGKDPFETEGIWVVFEIKEVLGHEDAWPWLGHLHDEEALLRADELEMVTAAVEILLGALEKGLGPNKPTVTINLEVDEGGKTEKVRVALATEPPKPAAKGKGKGKSRRRK